MRPLRPTLLLLMVLLTAVAPTAAALADPPDVTQWKWARPLTDGPPGWTTFALDGPIYASARADLADLRIVDQDKREIPWRLVPPAVGTTARYPVQILDALGDEAKASVVLDLGRANTVTNRVVFATSAQDFFARLSFEVSNDLRAWQSLAGTGYLYDMSAKGGGTQLSAEYPETSYRYLRVTMVGIVPKVGSLSAQLERQQPPADERVSVPAEAIQQEQPGHDVRLTFDLNYAGIPVTGVRLSSAAPLFRRAVVTEGSQDGQNWRVVTRAAIYRYADREQLTFDLPRSTFRYYRLTVVGDDNAPLAPEGVTFLTQPARVLFERPGGRPLYLLYGNPGAPAPRYDSAPFQSAPAHQLQAELGPALTVLTGLASTQPMADMPKSDVDPQLWRYERPLVPGGRSGFVQVDLDPATLDGARPDLVDLRLVDAAGHEIPLQVRQGREAATVWPYHVANQGHEQQGGQDVTWWVLDLGARNLPSQFLGFGGVEKNFSRDVTIEGSNDGKFWSGVARGQVRSLETLFGTEEQRLLSYPAARYRYLRVTVAGQAGDLAPAAVKGFPPAIVFWAEPGHTYQLFYGNAAANPRSYPVGAFAGASTPARLDQRVLGAPVDHAPPPPRPAFLEPGTQPDVAGPANPWLRWALWGLLALLVAGMGYGVVRVFRLVATRGPEHHDSDHTS